MKNFLLATAYLAGVAWWAGAGMVRAAAGSWWTILAFFAVLTFVLVRIGCLDADKQTADRTGAAFTLAVTIALLVLAVLGFGGGAAGSAGNGGAIVRLVLALAYGGLAFYGWRSTREPVPAH
ncbi:MAG TPA: hypothetical protein VMV46_14755 [Thermoanaerobaculia bacterium]|nr:hypothetical protein [Thermoanaerobaculia bacterium]